MRVQMPGFSLHSEAAVGLALLEERCNGLLDHLEAHFACQEATTRQQLEGLSGAQVSGSDLAASLSWLEQAGAVTAGGHGAGAGVCYTVTSLLPDLLHDARIAGAGIAAVRQRPRIEDLPSLVVSWPHSLPLLRTARWRSSRMAIIDLLDSATRSVIMLFPFVDRVGVDEIATAIQRALLRGVTVMLMTRYLRDTGSPNALFSERIRSIGEPACGLFRPLQLAARGLGDEAREVLHAKVLVTDGGRRGYVGSANLTGTALDESLEVGVLIAGQAAAALGVLLEEIVALAEAA